MRKKDNVRCGNHSNVPIDSVDFTKWDHFAEPPNPLRANANDPSDDHLLEQTIGVIRRHITFNLVGDHV